MTASQSQDPSSPDPTNENETPNDIQRGGSGAASALERMKADHAVRHRHRHGARASGPGHEDDRTPER